MSAPERIKVARCHPFKEPDDFYVCHPRLQHPAAVEYIRADLVPQWQPKVKPLEWEDYPYKDEPVLSQATCLYGTYFIVDDVDDFSGAYMDLVSHDNAEWWQHVRSTRETISEGFHGDDVSPLKAAAQADYERRILSALDTPPEAD